jgi:hypothetical protein
MVRTGETLFPSRSTCNTRLAILALICYLLILVSLECGEVQRGEGVNAWIGDLHDGNGLSDAALPNGVLSNPIFDEIEYDVLTIGKGCSHTLK